MLIVGVVKLVAAALAVLAPAWWLAGRLEPRATPFFRFLVAAGLALTGYVSLVNLVGRVARQSTIPASAVVLLCAAWAVWLWRNKRDEISPVPLWYTRREWTPSVLVALVLGVPQFILAITTPYWDEVASSAIHLTAVNQFADGVFPPRHNALPDVVTKYHYGFAVLSGSVRWLTGLSPNHSVDVVSTTLWLFAFLFILRWLRNLGFNRAPALWGATASLLGGGLAWAFVKKVESYVSFEVAPPANLLLHAYQDTMSVAANLVMQEKVPSMHLRNADGSISNLPWDIAAQFQQHAVSLGIALGIFTLYVFVRWQRSTERRAPLMLLTVFSFGVLFLAHAVFGGVAAVTGGLVLLGRWLVQPKSKQRFLDGIAFGVGVAVVGLAHGGFLATGREYGASADVFTLRHAFGYSRGGLMGFLRWNLAGFGLPLLLALLAWFAQPFGSKRRQQSEADLVFIVLTVFAVFSYMLPQLAFYTAENSATEQSTEVSKFFFTAHLGFALLSAWGVAMLARRIPAWLFVPAGAAMVVTPLMFVFTHTTKDSPTVAGRRWIGAYYAPYRRNGVEQSAAEAMVPLKRSNHDAFYDASADEQHHGFLNELLLFGGSVFTTAPSRYERTGLGYRLSQEVIGKRMVQNGRMALLEPGAIDDCHCRFYYTRPLADVAIAPAHVRARVDKAIAEGAFVERYKGADRVLYSIEKGTNDTGLERYWRPRAVMQTHSDWDGDGRDDLAFYDYVENRVRVGNATIDGPDWLRGHYSTVAMGRFADERRASLLFGYTKDTKFRLGRTLFDILETNSWAWSTRSSTQGAWSPEEERWGWNVDVPLVLKSPRGKDLHMTWHSGNGAWYEAPYHQVAGPSFPMNERPVPFTGRFLPGSDGDIAIRSRTTAMIAIQSLKTGKRVDFRWGLGDNEVLVTGDWDGDGYDEMAIYNETNRFWYWRRVPDGPITQFQFGVANGVPLPADYNRDGVIDAAYWVPADNKIYVTYSRGRSIDATFAVPAHSIPVFVNVF